jgi:hypothetical protein
MRSHNNPSKNRVREAWMEWLPASYDTCRSPVGLYLQGRENLELSGYRAKNLMPRQLVGCENNMGELPAVVRSAHGVRVIAGSPSEAVAILMRERVDPLLFANLDFEGAYETYAPDILATLRLLVPTDENEPTDLAVTSFAGRAHALKLGSLHASKFHSTLGDHEIVHTQLAMMERRYGIVASMLADPYAERFGHLRRELGFLWWVVMGLGLMGVGRRRYGEYDTGFLRASVNPALRSIEARLSDGSQRNGLRLVREPALAEALERQVTRLWPTAFKHILYYSPLHQPMQTWFIKIWRMDEGAYTVRDLVRQVWDLAVRTPLTFISSDGMEVVIGNQ